MATQTPPLWSKEATSGQFGPQGIVFYSIFSIAVVKDDDYDDTEKMVYFTEESTAYHVERLSKADAIRILKEAIEFIEEEYKK